MVNRIIQNISNPDKGIGKACWMRKLESHPIITAHVNNKAFLLEFHKVGVTDKNDGAVWVLQDTVYQNIRPGQQVNQRNRVPIVGCRCQKALLILADLFVLYPWDTVTDKESRAVCIDCDVMDAVTLQ